MIFGYKVKSEHIKENNRIFNIVKIKSNLYKIIIFAVVIISLSSFYLVYAWDRYQDVAESEAIMLAQSLEAVFHPEHIAELTGSADDLEKYDYKLTKQSLIQLLETSNPIQFAYLMIEIGRASCRVRV